MRRGTTLRQLQSGINAGRQRLAQQFATMEGWQAAQDTRFDAFIKEKRDKERFEAFDQRVERGYRAAAALHKAEVVNAFKRRLKEGGEKYTAATALALQREIEDRLAWLRDVWTQIDADYRCGGGGGASSNNNNNKSNNNNSATHDNENDSGTAGAAEAEREARQQRAAAEIAAALRGEPGDYMRWVYDEARERRFLGPKGAAAWEAEMADAHLPNVADEEVSRYHALRPSMADIEARVKTRYGLAGQQHWAELQAAKDATYAAKLERAADVYKALLAQGESADESRRTQLARANLARTHEAQVRFRSAMALEEERERLMEAHREMERRRREEAAERRKEMLREAAELKARGATAPEVRELMRQRQLDEHARRQAERHAREQSEISAKKAQYTNMLEALRDQFERRDGEALLARQPQPQPQPSAAARTPNAFGFMDDDREFSDGHDVSTSVVTYSMHDSNDAAGRGALSASSSSSSTQDVTVARAAAGAAVGPYAESQKGLYDAINADVYESPFHAVHQARLDAEATYDSLYATHTITNLAQGKRYSKQTTAGDMAGGGGERRMYKGAVYKNQRAYNWGVQPGEVHNLDEDGSLDYMTSRAWHVRDKETGDIDWRYEKRRGGAAFRGPRFYRIGAEREARDAAERTVDPGPVSPADLQRRQMARSGGGGGGNSNNTSANNSREEKPRVLRWKNMD